MEYGDLESERSKLDHFHQVLKYVQPDLDMNSGSENHIPNLSSIKNEEPLDLSRTDSSETNTASPLGFGEDPEGDYKPNCLDRNHVSVIRFSGRNEFS